MTEYLYYLLAVYHFFDVTVKFTKGLLLFNEVLG